MARVSENSAGQAIKFSLSRTKQKLEDLQLKGASLKRINKPSDDPLANIDLLHIRSQKVDSEQYSRNTSYAKTQLDFTEAALSDLTEIVGKAKEIAIAQSSVLYNPEVRRGVAKEVSQLRNQVLSIGNRKLGSRYIFAGHASLSPAFSSDGKYQGDSGKVFLEVNRNNFLPINLTGDEVFYGSGFQLKDRTLDYPQIIENNEVDNSLAKNIEVENIRQQIDPLTRKPANEEFKPENIEQDKQTGLLTGELEASESIFDQLSTLENALVTDNADIIQDLLPKLDLTLDRIVTIRTKVGSLQNSLQSNNVAREQLDILYEAQKSRVEDADVAELFSDLKKQNAILNATYKAASQSINRTLLDFLR